MVLAALRHTFSSPGWTQEIRVGRSGAPPTPGWASFDLSCRRNAVAHSSHDDPRLAVAIGRVGGRGCAFVHDMQVGARHAGFGSRWWADVHSALELSGVSRVRLNAQEVGGYFWAKHGFEIKPSDIPGVLRHAAEKCSTLDGQTPTFPYGEWARHLRRKPVVHSLHTMQDIWAHLPAVALPSLTFEGALDPTLRPLRATLLTDSRWEGRLDL